VATNNWREQAILLFPERASLYQQPNESIWDVLFDLLPEVIQAHALQDLEQQKRIYEFTEWCHSQKILEPEIWSAAIAAFYEHLPDNEITLKAISHWVKPQTFEDLKHTFQKNLEAEVYQQLFFEYQQINPNTE